MDITASVKGKARELSEPELPPQKRMKLAKSGSPEVNQTAIKDFFKQAKPAANVSNSDAAKETAATPSPDVSMSDANSTTSADASSTSSGNANAAASQNGTSTPNTANTDVDANNGSDAGDDVKVTTPTGPRPSVWADKRQSLCEASPYFKAHQGGLYRHGGYVHGYLISGECRPRDIIGDQVIITSVSGGRKRDQKTGAMHRYEDQEQSNYYKCLQKNLDHKRPIYVILGSNHQACVRGLIPKHENFMVLGWFHVVRITQEKDRQDPSDPLVKIWVVRLEKVELDRASWWSPVNGQVAHPLGTAMPGQFKAGEQQCGACRLVSKQMFSQAWTCMNPDCKDFFGALASFNNQLTYSDDYLKERTAYEGDLPLQPIIPALPSNDYADGVNGTEVIFRQGLTCHKCGCCSSRRFWNAWVCENPKCKFKLDAKLKSLSLAAVLEETKEFKRDLEYNQNGTKKKKVTGKAGQTTCSQDWQERYKDQCIPRRKTTFGAYNATAYLLPDRNGKIIGSITHIKATEKIQKEPHGPNELWNDLQAEEDLGLKRNPVRHPNKILTRHFAQNFGAEYKFVVSVGSKNFENSPDTVLKALMRMTWAGKAVVGSVTESLGDREHLPEYMPTEFKDFNELLLLGYMEKDAISYHDDGENELGPTVATLSLGGPSSFSVCPKESAGIVSEKKGKDPLMLKFVTQHGDMIVMHGAAIHRYYKHKVDPHGMRRFAMTCRWINPAKKPNKETKEKAIRDGVIPEKALQFTYNGGVQDTIDVQGATTAQLPAAGPSRK